MNRLIGLKEMANLTNAVSQYQELIGHFPSVAYGKGEEKERLDNLLSKYNGEHKDWWNSPIYNNWGNIEIHISTQTWSNTSCGWAGIGGSAMSRGINYIIINKFIKTAFVYWDGKLAYICPDTEIKEGFRVPSIREVKEPIFKGR